MGTLRYFEVLLGTGYWVLVTPPPPAHTQFQDVFFVQFFFETGSEYFFGEMKTEYGPNLPKSKPDQDKRLVRKLSKHCFFVAKSGFRAVGN